MNCRLLTRGNIMLKLSDTSNIIRRDPHHRTYSTPSNPEVEVQLPDWRVLACGYSEYKCGKTLVHAIRYLVSHPRLGEPRGRSLGTVKNSTVWHQTHPNSSGVVNTIGRIGYPTPVTSNITGRIQHHQTRPAASGASNTISDHVGK